MRWSKPGTGLVVLATAVLTAGGLLRLADLRSETAAVATLAVVVAVLGVGILAGSRRSGGPTNPYW